MQRDLSGSSKAHPPRSATPLGTPAWESPSLPDSISRAEYATTTCHGNAYALDPEDRQRWRSTALTKLMEPVFLQGVEEDDPPRQSPPFILHFASGKEFGLHCGDERIREWNEEIERQNWEWKKERLEAVDFEAQQKVSHRRRTIRTTFRQRMRENFSAALLRKEPHALSRVHAFLQQPVDRTSESERDILEAARHAGRTTLVQLAGPRPKGRVQRISRAASAVKAWNESANALHCIPSPVRAAEGPDAVSADAQGVCAWSHEAIEGGAAAPAAAPAGEATDAAEGARPKQRQLTYPATAQQKSKAKPWQRDAAQAAAGPRPAGRAAPGAAGASADAGGPRHKPPTKRRIYKRGVADTLAYTHDHEDGASICTDLHSFETKLQRLELDTTRLGLGSRGRRGSHTHNRRRKFSIPVVSSPSGSSSDEAV